MLLWLEERELDVASFAKAKVGTTVGTWPVFITVCGGNKDAADFILTLDVGRLVRNLAIANEVLRYGMVWLARRQDRVYRVTFVKRASAHMFELRFVV
jgi:hypothetical protein